MMDAVCPKCSKSNGPLHFIMGLDYGPDFDFCCTSCREELAAKAMEAEAAINVASKVGDAKATPLRRLKRFRSGDDGVAASCDEPSS